MVWRWLVCVSCVSFWLTSLWIVGVCWNHLVRSRWYGLWGVLRSPTHSVRFPLENCFELHIDDSIYWFNYVILFGSVSTSESMIHRPCFQALHTVYLLFGYMFACCHFYFRLHLLLIIIHTTCILLSLCRTSAPIHLTSVLGVLGTQ
jgi:hypothetical protein